MDSKTKSPEPENKSKSMQQTSKKRTDYSQTPTRPPGSTSKNYYRQIDAYRLHWVPHQHWIPQFLQKTPVPVSTRSLLRMGLKFCPTRPRPTTNINKTLKRPNRDICHMSYLYYNPSKKKPGIRYIPELYISQKWNAPERYLHVEKCLEDFERHYRRRCLGHQKKNSH